MVAVNVRFDVPARLGPVPASGTMVWTPTRRRVVDGSVVLPAPFQVYVTAGAATVEVAPSGPDWAWRVDEIFTGLPQRTVYLTVPDVPGPVAYADLVAVDPETLAADAEPVAAWWARADETEATALAAKATAEAVAFDAAAGVFDGAPGPAGPAGPAGESSGGAPAGMSLIPGTYAVLNPGFSGSSPSSPQYALYMTPVYLDKPLTVSEVVVSLTFSTASSVELGYYTNGGDTFTRGESFGVVDTSTSGPKIWPGLWTLPAGVVWMAWLSRGGSPTFAGTNAPARVPGPVQAGLTADDAFMDYRILTVPGSYGELPASFVAPTGMSVSGNPVRFGVKVP